MIRILSTQKDAASNLGRFRLCVRCNGFQAQYDDEYGRFAKSLWPIASNALILPSPIQLPAVLIRPGSIARSVLIGSFALNPVLREMHPALAANLRDGTDAAIPEPLRLSLALTRGPVARVTGSIGGFHLFRPKVNNRNLGFMTLAQIYFPPLAWQLADADESELIRQEGWADVTHWLTLDPSQLESLPTLVASLPVVKAHRVQNDDDWTELLADEACFMIESDNALPRIWGSGA
jgi:hypothetical protein